MNHDCFHLFCQHIIRAAGEEEFESEAYIDAFLDGKDTMYDCNDCNSGGYITGGDKSRCNSQISR